ncbi:hypothetical protein ACSTJV_22560 [Vibrio parahaemolyticus]
MNQKVLNALPRPAKGEQGVEYPWKKKPPIARTCDREEYALDSSPWLERKALLLVVWDLPRNEVC